MQKTSKTFLLVASILSTVAAAIILACVPVFFVLGISPTVADMLRQALNNGEIKYDTNIPVDTVISILQGVFIFSAVLLIFAGACCLVNALIASKARRQPSRGLYIACIITGAISTYIAIPGGILGLIALSKKERAEQNIE